LDLKRCWRLACWDLRETLRFGDEAGEGRCAGSARRHPAVRRRSRLPLWSMLTIKCVTNLPRGASGMCDGSHTIEFTTTPPPGSRVYIKPASTRCSALTITHQGGIHMRAHVICRIPLGKSILLASVAPPLSSLPHLWAMVQAWAFRENPCYHSWAFHRCLKCLTLDRYHQERHRSSSS